MARKEALVGRPYAVDPHVRFDEGKVASTVTSRRGSLRCKPKAIMMAAVALCCAATAPVWADTYAYKVQYLESSGVQYIDTGIVPEASTGVRLTYEYMALVDGINTLDMIAGCRNGSAVPFYPVALVWRGSGILHERYVFQDALTVKHPYRTRHTAVVNDAEHRIFVDGSYMGRFLSATDGTLSCYLFAYNADGSPKGHSASRIYACEFFNNSTGESIKRFVPVVDNDGRPAMFDEIAEKLHYNLGSGADFTAGPKKDEPWYMVEYLESTGTQWIDTAITAKAKTMTCAGYKFTQDSQVAYAMIGGVTGPSRYYPVSLTDSNGRHERHVYGSQQYPFEYGALQHHEVVFNDVAGRVYANGRLSGTFSASFTDSAEPMYMFAAMDVASRKANYLAKARIWHYDIYEDSGTLCAQFLPAVAADGVPCMYNAYAGTNHINKGSGTFAAGRIVSPSVPLNLAARGVTPSDGLRVLPFVERPSYGTVFRVDDAYADSYEAAVRSDGVYLAAKGTAGDAARILDVTGETSVQFKAGEMPACASVVLSGTVRLTEDCDWRGLGTLVMPNGVTIDLNGHNLRLAGFTALPGDVAVITDSTAGKGELHVEVAQNDVLLNDRVALLGSLRLVKEGAGAFIASLPNQQYTGGTEVAVGVLRLAAPRSDAASWTGLVGPKSSSVTICRGATFDVNGNHGQAGDFVLAGGVLSNTGAAMGATDSTRFADAVRNVRLEDDSTIDAHNGILLSGGTIDLAGKTLTVNLGVTDAQLYMNRVTATGGGVLCVRKKASAGEPVWAHIYNGCNLSDVTLDLGVAAALYDRVPVGTLLSSYDGEYGSGPGSLVVSVRFRPVADSFHNVTMLDGSTIDLAERTGVWSTRSAVNCRGPYYLGAAKGATVYVDVADRTDVHSGEKVISWEAAPSLVHRWSFNNSLEDSVGGANASPLGTYELGATTVKVPGTSSQHNGLSLGASLLPVDQGPVTVELWLSQDKFCKWAKLFAVGDSGSDSILLSGDDRSAANYLGYLCCNGVQSQGNGHKTFGSADYGKIEHFSIVIGDAVPGPDRGPVFRRHTTAGAYIGGTIQVFKGWSLAGLPQNYTYLGGCWWNYTDAAATFDEVRIWRGALTPADIEANASSSADTIVGTFRNTAKFSVVKSGNGPWRLAVRDDGLYLESAAFVILVR